MFITKNVIMIMKINAVIIIIGDGDLRFSGI